MFEEAIPNGPSSESPAWRGDDTLFAMLFGLNDFVRGVATRRVRRSANLRQLTLTRF